VCHHTQRLRSDARSLRFVPRARPASTREEYGDACRASLAKAADEFMLEWSWEPENVVDALVRPASSRFDSTRS
jgi:hypothetical protein